MSDRRAVKVTMHADTLMLNGLVIDRDLNAALNIEKEGVPTVRRELTPADTLASTLVEYFNSIPCVRASMVVETGSSALIVKRTIYSRG
ncbi:MAG: hypothetical protein ACYCPW_05425 [Nitrososphaerales archaeon]